jgi:hypothetical protein
MSGEMSTVRGLVPVRGADHSQRLQVVQEDGRLRVPDADLPLDRAGGCRLPGDDVLGGPGEQVRVDLGAAEAAGQHDLDLPRPPRNELDRRGGWAWPVPAL